MPDSTLLPKPNVEMNFETIQHVDYYMIKKETSESTGATYDDIKHAGTLQPNTKFTATFDADIGHMKIIKCPVTMAVGKYIKDAKSENGDILWKPDTEAEMTEAIIGTTVNNNIVEQQANNAVNNSNNIIEADSTFTDSVALMVYTDSQEYYNNLKNGLRINDLRGVLGMPYQFSAITDPRIEETDDAGNSEAFGRVYSEKIIKNIPLLLMTPGTPIFMVKYKTEQRNKIFGLLAEFTAEKLESIIGSDGGKYYSLQYAYTEYFHYVNAMLRSAAYFLEIQNEKIGGKELGGLNWLYETSSLSGGGYQHKNSKLSKFLGPYTGSIAFYADAGTTVDDSFGNSTTESRLAGKINGISDEAREANFLMGNVGGALGIRLDAIVGEDTTDDINSKINQVLGNGNILSNLLTKGNTLLSGGRLIFPEIWSDSSFSRSYSCSMKLVSPSGDKLSVYLNILVPIYHLLAFTLPRGTNASQAYMSPFLVRAYYKGLFNVDMGVISGLSITKGDEGEWTTDGIPTVANVNFDIKDLYDSMYMSKFSFKNDYSIMSNIQELDYIANSCGVNVNDQEIVRTVKMFTALGFSEIKDKVTIGIFGKLNEWANQKLQNIFGKFN